MKYWIAASCVVVMCSGSALADDCADANTQADMNICAEQEFAKADARLNELYHQINARLKDDKSAHDQMKTAQRAWIAFRDAECAFVGSAAEGGSIQPFIISGCKTELTLTRNEQFGNYLKCEEGDLSCPLPPAN